ncbi:MAG: hypothetical protein GXX85_01965 [Ignavibacteria bacterium]|nr:hypothetical protein [Ignavibacteria bacterium]
MERVVNIAKDKKSADKYDILQQIKMTVEERQIAAKTLKRKYYGKDCKDVRETKNAG